MSEAALLERDGPLEALYDALALTDRGAGGLALVAGAAGLGKSTLVDEFVRHAVGAPTVLRGGCDPIDAPRPLGPFVDVAHGVDHDLARWFATGPSRGDAFAAALDLVDRFERLILVLEDLHWADATTLDLFSFIGRRLDRRPTLLVATFRSDEVDARHPLRVRLADVHRNVHARIDLAPLSTSAVERLIASSARPSLSASDVQEATGGNPFFVTEILAGDPDDDTLLTASVRDAVLARVSRLPGDARAVLDAAAISPGSIEPWLLEHIATAPDVDVRHGLDVCVDRELLQRRSDGNLRFRHELARLAIEEVIEPVRARRLHERALHALKSAMSSAPDVSNSRLAHHAVHADAGSLVLTYGPAGAQEALDLGDAPTAIGLLRAALGYSNLLDAARRGALLLQLAEALGHAAEYQESLDAYDGAESAFAEAGDHASQARALALSGQALWGLARHPESVARLRRADALLGTDPPTSHAASVVAAAWCGERMLERRPSEAAEHGRRALRMARELDDIALESMVTIQANISRCMAGDDDGLEQVRAGIRLAEAARLDPQISHGYSQIGSGFGELRRYDIAVPALRAGIAFLEDRELLSRSYYDHAWLARCELETGDWQAARARVDRLLGDPRCTGNTRLVVLCTDGWLRSRRAEPDDLAHIRAVLDEALDLGRAAQHIQRQWPATACRAEHSWSIDRLADEADHLADAVAIAEEVSYRPALEELWHWQHFLDGRTRGSIDDVRTPFGLSAAGRWDLAATEWDARGCPYEAAFARYVLGDRRGDAESLQAAHRTFTTLGANPMAARTSAALRELGAAVPRGANRATQTNPHGLTDRELDVLRLLPRGLTNAEIGGELFISTKTVGHHVSRVLSKLGVSNRAEAAVLAERLATER